MTRRLIKIALFLVPVLPLLFNIDKLPISPGSQFSDLLISHYPNMLFLERTLVEQHTVPLWNPNILGGYPFIADPLSGIFYPPGWLVMLFPLITGFNIVIALHLVFGGVGLYLFLREQAIGEGAALFGALAFEALPKLWAHLGAGHVTLIYAVSLTPWLFFVESKAGRTDRLWRWALPGALLALIFMADVRWVAYAGVAWALYVIFEEALRRPMGWVGRGVQLIRIVTNGGLSLLCAAPLLIPLVEFTRLSTRAQMTAADNLTLSLPVVQLFGLFYPYLRGPAEWMLYAGGVALALGIVAVLARQTRTRDRFWIGAALISLLFALGSSLPGMEYVARLPGFDLLRVPPRALFLTGMALVILASFGLDALIRGSAKADGDPTDASPEEPGFKSTRTMPVLFALGAFVLLLGVAALLFISQPAVKLQFVWGAVSFLAGVILVFLAANRRISAGALLAAATVLMLVDFSGVNIVALEFRPADQALNEQAHVAAYLAAQIDGEPFRVYSPSYSLPQQTAAQYRLELADGVNPLQLASYAAAMSAATGVPFTGYGVTLPPFENGEPATDNQKAAPDAKKLGLWAVKYVVAEYDLNVDGLALVKRFGNTRIYENAYALPRAFVLPAGASLDPSIRAVSRLDMRANDIALTAQGAGTVELVQNAYPGWVAEIDGKPISSPDAQAILTTLLGSGLHEIRWVFRPYSLYAGLVTGAIGWSIVLLCVLAKSARRSPA